MKNSPRKSAYSVLLRIERSGAYSDLSLDAELNRSDYAGVDSAFVSALVFGVLERKLTLDYNISLYLSKPFSKLRPEVAVILRLGAYQILYMDKIPDRAAVSETVALVRECKLDYASGLVNAVLRKIAQNGLKLPDNANDIVYSVPMEMFKLVSNSIGDENARMLFENSFGKPETVIRVNTLKTDTEKLAAILESEGAECKAHPLSDEALIISFHGAVTSLKSFNDGLFHVQDISSQLCAGLLNAREGDTVLDLCSAPGGKAFTVAQHMQNNGTLYAFDVSSARAGLISQGANRLGIDCIKTAVNDASVYNPDIPMADRVLCDAPCSGLGIIGKKPEIRYKNPVDFSELPQLQYKILDTASRYVKDGGTLVYSTCTVNGAENSAVCDRFISEHGDFKALSVYPEIERGIDCGNYLTLLPHINKCDGFFMSVFIRN